MSGSRQPQLDAVVVSAQSPLAGSATLDKQLEAAAIAHATRRAGDRASGRKGGSSSSSTGSGHNIFSVHGALPGSSGPMDGSLANINTQDHPLLKKVSIKDELNGSALQQAHASPCSTAAVPKCQIQQQQQKQQQIRGAMTSPAERSPLNVVQLNQSLKAETPQGVSPPVSLGYSRRKPPKGSITHVPQLSPWAEAPTLEQKECQKEQQQEQGQQQGREQQQQQQEEQAPSANAPGSRGGSQAS